MFATYVGARASSFRWVAGQDRIETYPSSPQGKRSFCGICGSVTPIEAPELEMVFVPAGSLEGALGIRPQSHIFVGSKAPWWPITDGLPQHEKFPPPHEAPDVPRPSVAAKPGSTHGGCLCGDVEFEFDGPPVVVMNCHCSRCRCSRGAAHATNAFVAADAFRFIGGTPRLIRFDLPGARVFGTTFCARCGSMAPRHIPAADRFLVPCGSLDSDPGLAPRAHIHVGSKAEWYEITDSLPQFAEGPPKA